MPLHTPSPHRFLAPAPPATQKAKPKPKPPSGLRHVASAQTPRSTAFPLRHTLDDGDEPRRVTPAKRFVVAPLVSPKTPNIGERRTVRDQVHDEGAYTQNTPRPRLPLPKLSRVESIDSTSPSSSANAEAHYAYNVVPSVEPSVLEEDEGRMDQEEEEEILFVIEERNKRRRVSPHIPTSPTHARSDPPTPHELSSPQIPSPVSHRFKVPAPRPPVFDNTSISLSDCQSNSRPHFILPRTSPSPTKSATPLPETFSPSRKTGKYIPDGYTAVTNSAVVWGRDKEEGVRIKVRVIGVTGGRGSDDTETECWPGGVVFVRGNTDAGLYNASRAPTLISSEGYQDDHAEIKIMLAGQGGARGKGGVRIRQGGVVGVRAPIWDVRVGVGEKAEKWLVGVEWVVL
ncbi:hypothetical protein N0V90_004734 [Kalmusia sp. IMI 367209]|nr:hypothetical protein N0V90_004734 [Kalmusia sp. IMI 367209]